MSTSSPDTIENWILDYGLYGPEEKTRIEAYVQDHPEWEPAFRTAIQWEALLSDARALAEPERDVEHLPYAVASWELPDATFPNPLRWLLTRLFRRTEQDPRRLSVRDQYVSRLIQEESTSHAAQHFEKVSGHRVRDMETTHGSAEMLAEGRRQKEIRPVERAKRAPVLVPRVPIAHRIVRGAGMVAGAYLMLFVVSTYRDAPLERMAHLRSSDLTWPQVGVSSRGFDPDWVELLEERYTEALAVAASSQKSFLGLFPAYRIDRVRRAKILLQEVVDFQEQREPAPSEAYLTLAKLHFLSGDTLQSLDTLRELILRKERRDRPKDGNQELF